MKRHPLAPFVFCPRCGGTDFAVYDTRAKRCADCGFVFYANASAAAAAVVRNRSGELLLVRRAFAPARGTLCFPGGFAEPGEALEHTCLRELHEETGLEGRDPRFLFTIPNLYTYSDLEIPTIDAFFEVRADDETALFAADDAESVEWHAVSPLLVNEIGLTSHREAWRRLSEK